MAASSSSRPVGRLSFMAWNPCRGLTNAHGAERKENRANHRLGPANDTKLPPAMPGWNARSLASNGKPFHRRQGQRVACLLYWIVESDMLDPSAVGGNETVRWDGLEERQQKRRTISFVGETDTSQHAGPRFLPASLTKNGSQAASVFVGFGFYRPGCEDSMVELCLTTARTSCRICPGISVLPGRPNAVFSEKGAGKLRGRQAICSYE